MSCVDVAPVPLVVSPSLPAAVDLSVCYSDDLPLNLSMSSSAGVQQVSDAGMQSHPPPAHCHVTAPAVLDSKLSTDALTRLHRQWTLCCNTDACSSAACTTHTQSGLQTTDTLRSLDVLSAAAALRSEMLDRRLVLPSAAADTVTSSINSCWVSSAS